jgi:hypothetical protein
MTVEWFPQAAFSTLASEKFELWWRPSNTSLQRNLPIYGYRSFYSHDATESSVEKMIQMLQKLTIW